MNKVCLFGFYVPSTIFSHMETEERESGGYKESGCDTLALYNKFLGSLTYPVLSTDTREAPWQPSGWTSMNKVKYYFIKYVYIRKAKLFIFTNESQRGSNKKPLVLQSASIPLTLLVLALLWLYSLRAWVSHPVFLVSTYFSLPSPHNWYIIERT